MKLKLKIKNSNMQKILLDRNKLTAHLVNNDCAKNIKLSTKEFKLLEILYANKPEFMDSFSLSEAITGHKNVTPRLSDVYVFSIRKKFGQEIIKSVKTLGYCIGDDFEILIKNERPSGIRFVQFLVRERKIGNSLLDNNFVEEMYRKWISLGAI